MKIDENYRLAQCAGKEAFDNPQDAYRVVKRSGKRWQNRRKKDRRRPYRCPNCGLFHLAEHHKKHPRTKGLDHD